MKGIDKLIGSIFITLGLALTLANFDIIHLQMAFIWPGFILIPGLIFEYAYFSSGKAPGLLFPGAILSGLGLIFFFHAFTNFALIEYLWPLFILPTGLAFLQFYWHGNRHKAFLILFFIFSAITAFFIGFQFLIFNPYLVFSMVFLIIGGILLTSGTKSPKEPK